MTTANLHPSVTPLIVANWKAEGSLAGLPQYIAALQMVATDTEIVLCPPAPLLLPLRELLGDTGLQVAVRLGGQDCRTADEPAASGGVKAALLADIGCKYILIGHADRRACGDDDIILHSKLEQVAAAGLTPIYCISDFAQLDLLASLPLDQIVIAYEPLWAIGTGRTPELHEIAGAMAGIAQRLTVPGKRILYGGSVTADNASSILALPGCDGLLIGKAAYTGPGLAAILAAIAKAVPPAV